MANALVEKTRNELAMARKRPRNALLDAARGGLMGVTTDVLGYPVDVATMALRPLGYNVEKPVGGSDWLAERVTSPTGSVAETAGRVVGGMLTPGPEDIMRLAGFLPQKAPINELTTYHGSPHRINNVDEAHPLGKFDLSKIGTGEGAQAYGHGIYLAESPGVAKQYQMAFARRADDPAKYGTLPPSLTQPEYEDWAALSRKMIKDGNLPQDEMARWRDLQDRRRTYEDAVEAARPKAHFYTVDLPDEHIAKMLDWDAPLSEQPEAVKKLLRGSDIAPDESVWDQYTGQQLYEGEMQAGGPYKASGWANAESRKAVSEKLRSLGIPGIKYFDGGSRAAGEGTRNFVIFDPDIAKILKRE